MDNRKSSSVALNLKISATPEAKRDAGFGSGVALCSTCNATLQVASDLSPVQM